MDRFFTPSTYIRYSVDLCAMLIHKVWHTRNYDIFIVESYVIFTTVFTVKLLNSMTNGGLHGTGSIMRGSLLLYYKTFLVYCETIKGSNVLLCIRASLHASGYSSLQSPLTGLEKSTNIYYQASVINFPGNMDTSFYIK